ncbi:hypothetical protein HK102_011838 [Quaeritorhiza haematococci]|nr:hypothetical protein HK102_011838 [Quaeritorhiza haematococci]
MQLQQAGTAGSESGSGNLKKPTGNSSSQQSKGKESKSTQQLPTPVGMLTSKGSSVLSGATARVESEGDLLKWGMHTNKAAVSNNNLNTTTTNNGNTNRSNGEEQAILRREIEALKERMNELRMRREELKKENRKLGKMKVGDGREEPSQAGV